MKRIVSILLMVTLLMGSITVHAETLEDLKEDIQTIKGISNTTLTKLKSEMAKTFTDYDSNAWYGNYMAKLVGIGGIKGYTDGKVKPNGTITRAEFTKILVASLYGEQKSSSIHWSWEYKEKAEEANILSDGEFNLKNLDSPITREEMAKMVVLAAERKLKEKSKIIENVDTLIKDINSGVSKNRDYIRKAYSKGIIGGYPDKTFKPSGKATRAEACTILVRLLDDGERVVVKVPEIKERQTTVINGYEVPKQEDTALSYGFGTEAEVADGYSEIYMHIDVTSETGLEEQYQAVEMALRSQFSKDTVNKAISTVKKKTTWEGTFESVKLYEGSKYISIVTGKRTSYIRVQVFGK